MDQRFTIIRGQAVLEDAQHQKRAIFVLLALLPMSLAIAGALWDERAHLGITNWRSACRASGLSLASLLTFTWELLPTAIIGMLLGGLVVQCIGLRARDRGHARACLAAHAGCALAMPLGLVLCALAFPASVTLVTEGALAVAIALGLTHASVVVRRRTSHGA
ncbi:MAG: hypothetical protein ABI769_18430 [Pseudomonadota bacterium]